MTDKLEVDIANIEKWEERILCGNVQCPHCGDYVELQDIYPSFEDEIECGNCYEEFKVKWVY